MSVRVQVEGKRWELEFNSPTMSTYADSPADEAEQFAKILEEIAATLRRMYPKEGK